MLKLESLNEIQREAVMHETGPLLVLAGPGSGKTFTITQRIFFLIEEKRILPEKILVITFTKEAALSMQSRFFQSSNSKMYPVNFGTFHSIFYHILVRSQGTKLYQILNVNQKRSLLIPIIKKYQSEQEDNELVDEFIVAISYYKNTGDLESSKRKISKRWQDKFEEIFNRYEQTRKKVNGIDFDDMVFECYHLLKENLNLCSYWQERFQHILIDEFQDISPMQYEVVKLLSGSHSYVFAVGDDDQSIYGFRGSKPACLKLFADEFHARILCLNINYRSEPFIVNASGTMIQENKSRFKKELYSLKEWEVRNKMGLQVKTREGSVQLKKFIVKEEEYDYLVEHLREKERLHQVESIGILFRTNTYMQGVASRLHREGISFQMKENMNNIYQHFIVQDIMAYLKVAQGNFDRRIFYRIMNKPSRFISREAVGEKTPNFDDILRYYQRTGRSMIGEQGQKTIHMVNLWKHQMEFLKKLSPHSAVSYVRRAIGYERYLMSYAKGDSTKFEEWVEVLDWLEHDAEMYSTLYDWIEAQKSYQEKLESSKKNGECIKSLKSRHNELQVNKQQEECKLKICLMTVHASKGLEFDEVIVPDCNEKIFPYGKILDIDEVEEERRVFYVAMTRAKKSLELLYLVGTKEHPRLPSRFLNLLV